MTKNASQSPEAVGWIFWLIVFALLAGPCIFGAWKISDEYASRLIPLGAGTVAAAIGAGVVSWAVNAVFQWRRKRRRIAERKRAKKRK